MRRGLVYLTAISIALIMSGCGATVSKPDNHTGIVGGELVVDFPADLLKQSLIDKGLLASDSNATVFGYKGYLIEYDTTNEKGEKVKASGLMVIPTSSGVDENGKEKLDYMKSKGFSLVSDDHGTIFSNENAPTIVASMENIPDGSPIMLTSLFGFVTLQPDYIGFGSSAGMYHPYLLRHSSASATIDFIEAAKKFAKDNNIPLNGQIFLTGYSEGGYASLATLQEMERSGKSVTYAAPMAGPYMMDKMAQGVLSLDEISHPSFVADVAYSYAMTYNKPVSELIQAPYDSMLDNLFNGDMTIDDIDASLTHKVSGDGGLFTDTAVDGVLSSDTNFWFYSALQLNSPAYWAPRTPTRFIQCLGDDVIPYSMTTATVSVMRDRFEAKDVDAIAVEPVITGDENTDLRLGHKECALPAYYVAGTLFASIREATIGY